MRAMGAVAAVLASMTMLSGMTATVAADDAYVESTHFAGYVACGFGFGVGAFSACATTAGTPVDTFDAFLFEFEAGPGLEQLVVGLRWSPATPLPANLWFILEVPGCSLAACPYEYASATGPSDIVLSVTDDNITDPAFEFSNIVVERGFQMRVFADPEGSVLIQQSFDIYVHEFYNARAPDGFDPFPA